jgi:putative NIF3 family GTP cyclohydrolase 1 type 2/ribonuclease HI
VIRADGAARGNPGPASAGAVLIDAARPDAKQPDAPPLAVIARPLGVQTNNFAEYTAVVLALRRAHDLGAEEVELVLDSKLVVEQLAGRWKVRHPAIAPLFRQAQAELAGFRRWSIRHEPRAANRAADALANLALDDPPAAAAAESVHLPAPRASVAPAPASPRPEVVPRSPSEIADFLDTLLNAASFRANEPENGLMLDAGQPVRLVGASVNTSFAAIDAAADAGAELLLVHHASWSYIDRSLHEKKMARLRERGVSLYCAHASLDGADRIGTGFAMAGLLGIDVDGRFAEHEGAPAGVFGQWTGNLADLVRKTASSIGGQPEVHENSTRSARVGMVTGAGGFTSFVEEARDLGCDTYLTGEGSMYTRLFAREAGINLVLAGHYRTEAPGIKGLAAEVAKRLDVGWQFIEDEPIG